MSSPRRPLAPAALLLLLTCLLGALPRAEARTISFLGFRPALDTNGFFQVESATDLRQWDWAFGMKVRFDRNPLVLRLRGQNQVLETQITRDIGTQVYGSVNLFDWLQLGLEMPVSFTRRGKIFGQSDFKARGFLAGDLRAQLKIVPLREEDHYVSVGLVVGMTFPTGSSRNLYGTDGIDVLPSLVISKRFMTTKRDYLSVSLQGGYRITGEAQTPEGTTPLLVIDDEITFGLGLGYYFGKPRLSVLGEIVGRTAAKQPFEQNAQSPVEFIGGVRWFPYKYLAFDLGAGGGLVPGYSSTDFRIFAGVTYSRRPRWMDVDGDGIEDDQDRCPDEAEDRDGFQDDDGCPDVDHDGDGIPNEEDACVTEAEDFDGYQDKDGCPDRDNDGDGIPDDRDKCPGAPENFNGFSDEDGCPENPDELAKLPASALCPPAQAAIPAIPQRLLFARRSATLTRDGRKALAALVELLKKTPAITRIEVLGNADDFGAEARNLKLSERRASRVLKALVHMGVPRRRLQAHGYGNVNPPMGSDVDHNRMVRFRVVEMAKE